MRGVGGWLLLLCLGLTVFGPVLVVIGIVRGFLADSPYFDTFPRLRAVFFIDAALRAALTAFGIYAGVRLGTVRRGAVRITKTYFMCAVGYLIVGALLPFTAGLPSAAYPALAQTAAQQTIPALISVGIWYAYLCRSKRVKATYEGAA
jgi:Protein of unknown function (DUF2569)